MLRSIVANSKSHVKLAEKVLIRFASTLPTEAVAIRYQQHGQPLKVLEKETVPLPAQLAEDEVLVRFMAAPINPADLNMVEGVYPISPPRPAVGGNEGVASVLAVGAGVKGLKEGDWVVPAHAGFGTWRTHAVAKAPEFDLISKEIPLEAAATIAINPCTAYRLLKDYVNLKPGDTVAQNGANSAVGQAVIQLCKAWGIKTINVIRGGRPEVADRLRALGADIVVDEVFAASPEMAAHVAHLPKPMLALNCIGGEQSTDITRLLNKGGTMVTYGGMSKKPITIPTSSFIFKDITIRGFWLSGRWAKENDSASRQKMFNELYPLIKEGKLQSFTDSLPYERFQEAVHLAQSPLRDRNTKVLLRFD